MQQAIKLLQLSSVELEQEVQKKLDSNPLLERVEEDSISAEDFNSVEELTRQELNAEALKDTYELNDDTLDGYDVASYDDYDAQSEEYQTSYDDHFSQSENNKTVNEQQSTETRVEIKASTSNTLDATDTIVTPENKTEADLLGELPIDTDWEDIYTHSATGLARPDNQGLNDYQGTTSVSLQDHIRWQLNFSHLTEQQSLIADYLIDAMDENGFIQIDTEDLKASFDEMASFYSWETRIEYEHIEAVITLIQSFEPLGVGARNLAESLQIQLKHLDQSTAYRDQAISLLDEHELLVSNNIKELMHRTGLNNSDIGPSIELIRTLNAAPGLAFSTEQPHYGTQPEAYDIPDVLVQMVTHEDSNQAVWKVELNPETLPKLRVNQEYASLIKRGDDSADNVYLRDNLVDARLFIRSIEERNQNLLKVATSIVKVQQDFLIQGPTAMKPLILKEIADEVGLHESTVSRLTTSKSILTPQGLFSLKYFFSSHVSSDQGDISSTAISAMIQQLIQQEDPKSPLSDSAIKEQLKQQGIDIARRTVAKYREGMNIGSSTQRKVKF